MAEIKSSDDHLVLNAEGTAKDTKIQANGTDLVTVASTGNVNINGTVTADDNIQVDSGSGSTPTIKFTSNAQTGRYSQVKVDTNRDIVLTAGVGSVNEYPKIKMFTGTPSGEQERICIDGDGLKFNGDTAAANALDDYEEGTFTMGLAGETSGSVSLGGAYYTKIGRVVHFATYLNVSVDTTGLSGIINFTGFPFVPLAWQGHGTITYASSLTTKNEVTDTITAIAYTSGNFRIAEGSATNWITNSELNTGSIAFMMSGWYMATA